MRKSQLHTKRKKKKKQTQFCGGFSSVSWWWWGGGGAKLEPWSVDQPIACTLFLIWLTGQSTSENLLASTQNLINLDTNIWHYELWPYSCTVVLWWSVVLWQITNNRTAGERALSRFEGWLFDKWRNIDMDDIVIGWKHLRTHSPRIYQSYLHPLDIRPYEARLCITIK